MSLPLLQLNVAHTGVSPQATACARKGKRYEHNQCRDKTPEEKALTEAKMKARAILRQYNEDLNPDASVYEKMLLDLDPPYTLETDENGKVGVKKK